MTRVANNFQPKRYKAKALKSSPKSQKVAINIFQTQHISAMKFYMGYEKKNELSCDTRISKSWEKLKK